MGNSQIMSIRLSDEVQELFKASTQSSGLKQEEFLVKLLSTYAQHGEEQDTNITQEKAQVRAGLERIRVLVEAVIDRAGDQTKQAEESVKVKQDEFSQKFNELQEEVQKKNGLGS